MKKLTALLLILALLLSLAGCGGASTTAETYSAKYEAAAAPMMAAGAANDMVLANTSSGTSSVQLPENRKWIVTVDMNVETDDLEVLQEALAHRIEELGGYIENQSVYNGSAYANRRYRNANLTLRIPADRVEEFTAKIGELSNVVSNNLRREDVTLTYVATESKVNALKTEETRLLELLAQAETMSDLLEIEARLSDVRYELESYTTQLRTLTNQIDYATVYLFIEEVQEYTPVEEPTLWERISGGFVDSLEGLATGAVDLLVWVITSSPYLAVFAGLTIVAIIVTKRVRRIRRKKKENKQ